MELIAVQPANHWRRAFVTGQREYFSLVWIYCFNQPTFTLVRAEVCLESREMPKFHELKLRPLADADGRQHAPGAALFAAMAEKQIGVARGAESAIGNIFWKHARIQQLPAICGD
jgi:hypothetical protein